MKAFSKRKCRYCGLLPINHDADTINKEIRSLAYKND
jgi:hypothetical protein